MDVAGQPHPARYSQLVLPGQIFKRPPAWCRKFSIFLGFRPIFQVLRGRGGRGRLGGPIFLLRNRFFTLASRIFMFEIDFRAQKSIFASRRLFFFGFRLVFVIGEGQGGSGELFSCSGMDFSYPGIVFARPGLDVHAGGRLGDVT